MCVKLLQSHPTLYDPMDCSLPDFSVYGIHQARILEWVAMPSSRVSSQPRDRTHVSYVFNTSTTWKAHLWHRVNQTGIGETVLFEKFTSSTHPFISSTNINWVAWQPTDS